MLLVEEQELVHFAAESFCANSDRAVWRFAIYFKARDWMRSNWPSCLCDRTEWKKRSTRIMKAIVSNVSMQKNMDTDTKWKFARELKAVWYKVRDQVKHEFGNHIAEDYAQSLQCRREEEGISD
jgi:hypothetical protein